MKLWLDLEQTIISIWDDPVVCNVEKIKEFVANHQPTEINIFSFACWNNKDRDHFNLTMREWLNREFNFTLNRIHTCEEVMDRIFWSKGTVFTLSEFTAIWGKEKAFNDWIVETEEEGEFVLIDDVVANVTIHRPTRGQIIRTLNVDRLYKE